MNIGYVGSLSVGSVTKFVALALVAALGGAVADGSSTASAEPERPTPPLRLWYEQMLRW
jgi:hypothetical protein